MLIGEAKAFLPDSVVDVLLCRLAEHKMMNRVLAGRADGVGAWLDQEVGNLNADRLCSILQEIGELPKTFDTALPLEWSRSFLLITGFSPVGEIVWVYPDAGGNGPVGITVKGRRALSEMGLGQLGRYSKFIESMPYMFSGVVGSSLHSMIG